MSIGAWRITTKIEHWGATHHQARLMKARIRVNKCDVIGVPVQPKLDGVADLPQQLHTWRVTLRRNVRGGGHIDLYDLVGKLSRFKGSGCVAGDTQPQE